MKKHASRKGRPAQPDIGPDLVGLINKVQQQLIVLEKKIDILIGQSSKRPYEDKQSAKPFQRFDRERGQSDTRQDNAYRERVMHKAVCADCNQTCEVPFKPSGDRPVYCKECYSKRKTSAGPFKETRDIKHRPAMPVHAAHTDKISTMEDRKLTGKKRAPARRNKK